MTTTNTTPTKQVEASGWWSLPEEKQAEILARLEPRNTWTFHIYRVSDTAWALDAPEAETYRELLVGGTNQALDEHYELLTGLEAENDSVMTMTVSINPLDNQTTSLTKTRDDKAWIGSAYYLDQVLGIECFLCPFLQVIWGQAPSIIYAYLEV